MKKNQKYMFVLGIGIFFSLLLANISLSQIRSGSNFNENNLKMAIPGDPDLIDGGESYSDFNLTTVESGVSSFGVWCNVTNDSMISIGSSFNVSFYASLDTTINSTTGDYLIGKEICSALGAYASEIAKWTGTFPGSIPDGTYYIGWIIDVDNDVVEGTIGEANNIACITSKTLTVETSSGNGPPPPPPNPIPFIVGGVAAAVVVIPAGIYFVSKRRV